jgi:hypothetical protein
MLGGPYWHSFVIPLQQHRNIQSYAVMSEQFKPVNESHRFYLELVRWATVWLVDRRYELWLLRDVYRNREKLEPEKVTATDRKWAKEIEERMRLFTRQILDLRKKEEDLVKRLGCKEPIVLHSVRFDRGQGLFVPARDREKVA